MADSLPHLSPVLAALCTPGAMGGRVWRNSGEKQIGLGIPEIHRRKRALSQEQS